MIKHWCIAIPNKLLIIIDEAHWLREVFDEYCGEIQINTCTSADWEKNITRISGKHESTHAASQAAIIVLEQRVRKHIRHEEEIPSQNLHRL